MTLHEWFKECAKLTPELSDGLKKREALADKLAKLDAPILNHPEDTLKLIYLELLLNICLDEGLARIEQATPHARYASASMCQI